jgi:flagellar biogenesis protein FliO
MRCRRFIVGLALVACVTSQSEARADYPEFAPTTSQPSPWPGRNAGYVETDDPPQPNSLTTGAEASEPAPSRYAPQWPAAAVPTALSADTENQPQRIPQAKPGLPLAPPTAESKGGWRAEMSPMLSAAASLGIVLGLFLLVVMVVRRGMPKTAAQLPREAVQLLGRAPLVGRQYLHLVRCGNKLLLLSVSAGSSTTLTEITDPEEVERLVELCEGAGLGGSSFRQVLGQFTRQREVSFAAHRVDGQVDFAHLDAFAHETARGGRS